MPDTPTPAARAARAYQHLTTTPPERWHDALLAWFTDCDICARRDEREQARKDSRRK